MWCGDMVHACDCGVVCLCTCMGRPEQYKVRHLPLWFSSLLAEEMVSLFLDRLVGHRVFSICLSLAPVERKHAHATMPGWSSYLQSKGLCQGHVPRSLSSSSHLQFLDISQNQSNPAAVTSDIFISEDNAHLPAPFTASCSCLTGFYC